MTRKALNFFFYGYTAAKPLYSPGVPEEDGKHPFGVQHTQPVECFTCSTLSTFVPEHFVHSAGSSALKTRRENSVPQSAHLYS